MYQHEIRIIVLIIFQYQYHASSWWAVFYGNSIQQNVHKPFRNMLGFDTVKRYLDVAIHIFPNLCISNGSVLFQACFSMMISLAIWCVKKLMVDTIFVYKYLSWSHLVKPTWIKELFWYRDGKYSYVTKSNEPGALNECYKLRFCVNNH